MKIVFRVDASVLIGSGHVMRCLVLADALKSKEHEIFFACMPLKGDMRAYINERGYEVINLTAPENELTPTHDADYVAWLQKSVDEDARDFVVAVSDADLVITDHYAIDNEWQSMVTKALNCRLFAIDDLARCHHADLVLDQTLGRESSDYDESRTRVLVGSEYALLKPSFANKREQALSRVLPESRAKVLVSMGGIDAPNATLRVLKALDGKVDADFTVLLSPRAPHFNVVKTWCASKTNVMHIEFCSDMASLMLSHDVAIGAPGTTSWERACLGLPNIIVPLADNQQLTCEQLVKHNAAIKIDIDNIPDSLLQGYQTTLDQWQEFKQANLALCDGRGVRRVVFEIQHLFDNQSNSLSLCRALEDDIELVYQWQLHPETRRFALTPSVPTWDEHQAWMTRKLQSVSDYFYMVKDITSGRKLGVVRLDRQSEGHYLVSIFIEPNSYGKGIAFRVLAMIDAIHPDITLHATVLKSNLASQKLFQKASYQQVDEESFIRQPID